MSGQTISGEIITKITATANVPKMAAAAAARSRIFAESIAITNGMISPIISGTKITKAALETAAAAAAEIQIEIEVAVVIVSEEMTIIEMGSTIGAETGTETEIGVKLIVRSERIPQWDQVM